MSLNISSDSSTSFNWDDYLIKTNGNPAKPECFKQSLAPPPNHFEINTLLEAEDQRSAALDVQSPMSYSNDVVKTRGSANNDSSTSSLSSTRRSSLGSMSTGAVRRFRAAAFSLARVVETWGPRLRIRLIGTDDRNDYWLLVDCEQIRPYPSGNSLHPPFGYMHNHLVWNRTLKKATDSTKFAHSAWFIKPPPDPENNYFKVNDKLEAVDRRNTQLICPATIGAVNGQHVLISFDGWSGAFDYWARFDSRELFPVGWCKMANYPLQSPGPNVTRSPTNHSTPTIPRIQTSIQRNISYVDRPTNNRKINATNKFRSSSRLPSRRRTKSYSHSNKTSLFKATENSTPCQSAKSVSINKHVSPRNSLSLPMSNSVVGDWLGCDKPTKSASSSVKLGMQAESADSSNCSFSSPPTIHPVLDDLNDSLNNLSPSSQSDHPPRIEAAVPLTDDIQHLKRNSGSSDCVVRLQAKSPPNCEPLKPEFKSWQVVTEPREKMKKPKTAKHHKRNETDHNSLKKKLKLINGSLSNCTHSPSGGNEANRVTIHSDTETNCPNATIKQHYDSNGRDDLIKNDNSTLKPMITPTSQLEKQILNPKLSTSDVKNNCISGIKDQASAEQITKLHSTNIYDNSELNSYPNIGSHFHKTDLNRTHQQFFTDMNASTMNRSTNLTIDTLDSSTMGWVEGKGDSDTLKSVEVINNAHQHNLMMLDYFDNHSLTTHLPSSTVSPSSLDLGPCPLPNPVQWTIDEVYHYITTRDSTLVEAAEKFKHHEIDGQALLLLTMESLRNYMKIKLGPALKVDHLINRLKRGIL